MADLVNVIYITAPGNSFQEYEQSLQKDGVNVCLSLASDRQEFENLLDQRVDWDIVVYDDGTAALKIADLLGVLQENGSIHKLPLIILAQVNDLARSVRLLNQGVFRCIPCDELSLIGEVFKTALFVKRQWYKWERAEDDLVKTRTMYRMAEDASRKNEERYATLADNARDSIFEFTEDGYLVYLNHYATIIYGLPASELIGKHISDLFPEPHSSMMLQHIREVYKTGEPFYSIGDYPFNSGLKYLSTWLVPFKDKDGFCQSILGFSRDYSEVKEAENKLKQAFEKQKELNEIQTNFVMRTSHEFRTPLSAILSSAELLENYGGQWPEQKVQTHLRRIQESVKHLNRLLDDLLIIEKAESAGLRCEPAGIRLGTFFSQLVEEVQLGDKNRHQVLFSLTGAGDAAIMDERLLRQVVVNLLVNSLKFSPQGTEVKLGLTCDNSHAVIVIEDHGLGIPSQDQVHLFERFYRASNVVQIPGSGLGLTIVKEAVDLMEGEIQFVSQEGVGTAFTVTLPLLQKTK
jgi:PAS domain S-box-containing protein